MHSGTSIEVSGPGRRERRKAETRRRLLEAARALLVERGYHETRPQDIAEAADLAVGTFYVYFADKREAFLAFTEQVTEELLARMRERVASGERFEDRLGHALEALLEYSAANPGVLHAVSGDAAVGAAGLPPGSSFRDRISEVLAGDIAQGIARGEVRADYDADLVAHGVVGFIQNALMRAAALERTDALPNLKRFLTRALVARTSDPSKTEGGELR